MQEYEREYYKKKDHNISYVGRCIRVKTKYKQHYFTVSEYGSQQAALEAARDFRDSLPADNFRGDYDHDKCQARGESGILGVAKYMQRGDHAGWTACWQEGKPPNRHQRKKKFSFLKYGQRALEEAKAYREKMVRLHSIANTV
ncbi:hypothetical protein [Endozoicomonas sp. Mp262]|uniref:hypothetical protein n=1 Tax=Endozoicomonas sp. Mp262 TaxID=2919499 RepID=UPI0021D9AA7A